MPGEKPKKVSRKKKPKKKKGKKGNDKYLGSKFRNSMKGLMNELNSCNCSFIRCLKPNEVKKKGLWVPTLVLN